MDFWGWLASVGESFASQGVQGWLLSLLNGTFGAIIGALVAMYVLRRSLGAQQTALDLQLEAMAAQNVTNRTREAAAGFLTGMSDFASCRTGDREKFLTVVPRVGGALDRLYLDLSDEQAEQLIKPMRDWVFHFTERQGAIVEGDADASDSTFRHVTTLQYGWVNQKFISWIRGDDDQRSEIAQELVKSFRRAYRKDDASWLAEYGWFPTETGILKG